MASYAHPQPQYEHSSNFKHAATVIDSYSPVSGRRINGKWLDIGVGFAVTTLPMLILNVIIIAIVAKYAEPGSFHRVTAGQDTAILININPTTFTVITSWASTVAAIVVGFMTVLASYPACKNMLDAARSGALQGNLPTPYQLAIMLEIRSGGVWGAMKRLLGYLNLPERKRPALSPPLLSLSYTMVLGILLGILVSVTDTWLHTTTRAENIFHYSPSLGTNLSLSLSPRCLISNNSYVAQSDSYYLDTNPQHTAACTMNPSASNVFLVSSPIQPVAVLNNVSNIVVAKRHVTQNRTYAYLSPADTDENARQDYAAFTYAMSSQCVFKSQDCFNQSTFIGARTPFNCTNSNYYGNLSAQFAPQYYSDAALTKDDPIDGVTNPFYLLAVAWLWQSWPLPSQYNKDNEILTQVHGDYALALSCTTTVYDVTYQVSNGTVTQFEPIESNVSVTNALMTPIGFTNGANPTLAEAFSFVGLSQTGQEMLDKWAVEYDKSAISLSVVALQPALASSSVYRVPALVSRVPIAPLVSLLAVNMVYCFAGIVLGIVAIMNARDDETKEIVERLSIVGLVADRFEGNRAKEAVNSVNDLFSELSDGRQRRVMIGRDAHGGYAFQEL